MVWQAAGHRPFWIANEDKNTKNGQTYPIWWWRRMDHMLQRLSFSSEFFLSLRKHIWTSARLLWIYRGKRGDVPVGEIIHAAPRQGPPAPSLQGVICSSCSCCCCCCCCGSLWNIHFSPTHIVSYFVLYMSYCQVLWCTLAQAWITLVMPREKENFAKSETLGSTLVV